MATPRNTVQTNYSNIASIINNALLPNMLGADTVVAENLSNIVEVAKAVSSLTADDLKNFKKNLVVGCYNEVIAREYTSKKFKLLKDSIRFGGALQRITASGLMTAQDSHLLNLVNGTSYLDGKYYGFDPSANLVLETKAFKIVYSLSDDEFAMNFNNAQDVAKFIGLILVTAENTIDIELAQLEKRVLLMGITKAIDDNRVVPLLSLFNSKLGRGTTEKPNYTMTDISADRQLSAYFFDFVKGTIAKVRDYMTEVNQKYNDGTITTFTPKSMIDGVFITDFITDASYVGAPIMFNETSFGEIETISAWQNPSSAMLPTLANATRIEVTDGTDTTTYNNVIGALYDEDSMGITNVADKVTVEPVGAEGFTNYHHHLANKYYVDTRFGIVVFTLN